jgi:hypothetical protein
MVDGYTDLDPSGRPGLGARARAEFGIPVIGVAKSRVPYSDLRGAGHARILGAPAVRHRRRDVHSRHGGPGPAHGRPVPATRRAAPRRHPTPSHGQVSLQPPSPTASPANLRRRAERGMRVCAIRGHESA